MENRIRHPGIMDLIKNPLNINKLLYNKYGDISEDYINLNLDALIYSKSCHIFCQYKDFLIWDFIDEFLKRIYSKEEAIDRLPKIAVYYKNYLKFFCNPFFRDFDKNKIIQSFGDNKAEIYYKLNYGKKTKSKQNAADENINSDCSDSYQYILQENRSMLFNTSVRENIDQNALTQSHINQETQNSLSFLPVGNMNENENELYLKTDLLTRRSREQSSLVNILNNLGEDNLINMNKRINERFVNKINNKNTGNTRKLIPNNKYTFSTEDRTTKGEDNSNSIKISTIKSKESGIAQLCTQYYVEKENQTLKRNLNTIAKMSTQNAPSKISNPKNSSKEKICESNVRTQNNRPYKLTSPKNNPKIEEMKLQKMNLNKQTINQNYVNTYNINNLLNKNKISLCNIYKVNPWINPVNQVNNINLNDLPLNSKFDKLHLSNPKTIAVDNNTPINTNTNNINFPTGNNSIAQTPKNFNGSVQNLPLNDINNPIIGSNSPRQTIQFTRINEFRKNNPKNIVTSNATPSDSHRLSCATNRKNDKTGKNSSANMDFNTGINVTNTMQGMMFKTTVKNSSNNSVEKKIIVQSTKENNLYQKKNSDNLKISLKSRNLNDENFSAAHTNRVSFTKTPVKSLESNISKMTNLITTQIDNKNVNVKYTKIPINLNKNNTQETRQNSTNNFKRGKSFYNSSNQNNKQNFSNNSNNVSQTPPLFNANQNNPSSILFHSSRNGVVHTKNSNSIHIQYDLNLKNKYSNPSKINNYVNLSNKLMTTSCNNNSLKELYSFKSARKTQSIDSTINVNKYENIFNQNVNSRNKVSSLYKVSSNPIQTNKIHTDRNSLTHSIDKDISKSNTVTSMERKKYVQIPKENTVQVFGKTSVCNKKDATNTITATTKSSKISSINKLTNINKIMNGINQGITHKIKSRLQVIMKSQDSSRKPNVFQKSNLGKNFADYKFQSNRIDTLSKEYKILPTEIPSKRFENGNPTGANVENKVSKFSTKLHKY